MRSLTVPVIAALALLAGCQPSSQSPAGGNGAASNTPAPIPSQITGTVSLRTPMEIGPGAKLDVRLVDVAQPQVPIAEQTIDENTQPPYTFTLNLDPSKIDPSRTYVVNVTLTDGDRHFLPALNSPVLTHKSGNTATVVLNPEPTPTEKLTDAYDKLKRDIGGMKKVQGTYTTEDSSVGWDAFVESGQVRFVRVKTDYDKGGGSYVSYAFKDGKPMYVVERGGATVGWDDNGNVLVSKQAGSEVAADKVTALHDAAEKAFQMAQQQADAQKKRK